MTRFAVIMRTACFPQISYRKILDKFSTYPDPLEWILLLEDITTTESLNQSQVACRSIDHRIWLATVSHYVKGHIYNKKTLVQRYTPGGVRTLIALHHGRKTKSESFASCRGRLNISGGSEIAWMNVECNEDSLSVAVSSKVKKCYFSVTNSLSEGYWRDSERIKTAALPKNLFI